jgi:2-polyprenyl-3-methyl-5-hydroxy-6-metoxy-1,4-benzoquinol methylase
MVMTRTVIDELLDGLAVDDPAATRSRLDLRRLHRAMGTRTILRRAMRDMLPAHEAPGRLRVLELGAGDGSLMLGLARSLAGRWPKVELTLLDRQALVSPATLDGFAKLGWRAMARVGDALAWAQANTDAAIQERPGPRWDVVVANLFLHHFERAQLLELLQAVAARSACFVACEPRRSRLALAGSHLVGALGANAVTRNDAVLSVRAGFRDQELTALWAGAGPGWDVAEYSAGLFSHCFCARRLKAA